MAGSDANVEPPKATEDTSNYHALNISSDLVVNGNNMSNASSGIITIGDSVVEVLSYPLAPKLHSFCSPTWDQPFSSQNLGYCNMNVQNDRSTSSSLCNVRTGMGWTPNPMLRDSMFLPTVSRMISHSLPPFLADSAFIERAVSFSCFNGENFSEMLSPFSIPDRLNPHSWGNGLIQVPREVFSGDGSKQSPGRHEMNVTEVPKEASLLGKNATEGSLSKNGENRESYTQSHDEARNGVDVSDNQSKEAETSGRGAQEELVGTGGESSGKGLGLKKRKRTKQTTENYKNNEAPKPDANTAREKEDQNLSSTSNLGGKHGKQEPQGSDPPNEQYVHVRARRGQATNSHSLAERIRREKISERMKFLQDLVPGCSKVTGKAVMLDEIINYVQSLQRQVEFLSMKLATVNPQLDFNMEGFLAKNIVESGVGLSYSLSFQPDVALPYPPLQQPQPGLNQASLPGTRNSFETLRRPISIEPTVVVSGGLSKPTTQAAHSVWEDELHNVVHNGFNSSAPISIQDLSGTSSFFTTM